MLSSEGRSPGPCAWLLAITESCHLVPFQISDARICRCEGLGVPVPSHAARGLLSGDSVKNDRAVQHGLCWIPYATGIPFDLGSQSPYL